MSTHYYVYVGPYARCQNRRETTKVFRNACVNVDCASLGNAVEAEFCSACGGKIWRKQFPEEGWVVCPGDVGDDIDCRLSHIDNHAVDLWIPNEHFDAVGGHKFDQESGELLDCTTKDADLAAFNQCFSADIDTLKAAYGDEAVQVKWGILGAWS